MRGCVKNVNRSTIIAETLQSHRPTEGEVAAQARPYMGNSRSERYRIARSDSSETKDACGVGEVFRERENVKVDHVRVRIAVDLMLALVILDQLEREAVANRIDRVAMTSSPVPQNLVTGEIPSQVKLPS